MAINGVVTGVIIVIKPNSGVDPAKKPSLGIHGSTWVNSSQPRLIQKV